MTEILLSKNVAQLEALFSPEDASSWTLEKWHECAMHPDYRVWVLQENEIVKAAVLVNVADDVAQLMYIVVHPEARAQGYATKLLSAIQNELSNLSKTDLLLEVRVDNHAAIALYKKCGFAEIGRRKNYYHCDNKKYAAIVMKKVVE